MGWEWTNAHFRLSQMSDVYTQVKVGNSQISKRQGPGAAKALVGCRSNSPFREGGRGTKSLVH